MKRNVIRRKPVEPKSGADNDSDARDGGVQSVDRALCFNIGADPRLGYPDDGGLIYRAEQANDDTAAFVRAHSCR